MDIKKIRETITNGNVTIEIKGWSTPEGQKQRVYIGVSGLGSSKKKQSMEFSGYLDVESNEFVVKETMYTWAPSRAELEAAFAQGLELARQLIKPEPKQEEEIKEEMPKNDFVQAMDLATELWAIMTDNKTPLAPDTRTMNWGEFTSEFDRLDEMVKALPWNDSHEMHFLGKMRSAISGAITRVNELNKLYGSEPSDMRKTCSKILFASNQIKGNADKFEAMAQELVFGSQPQPVEA